MIRHRISTLSSKWPSARWILPAVAFAVLAVLSVVFWQQQRQARETDLHAEFLRNAALFSSELRERLNLHAQFLRTLGAYFATHPQPSAAEWRRFSGGIELKKNLPGATVFGFTAAINGNSLDAFEANARRLLEQPGYRIHPQATASQVYPVLYLAPATPAHDGALGFDMGSEALRRQAIQLAAQVGDVVMSGRITLYFDKDAAIPGFLMVAPVYRADMPTHNVEQRRKALLGVVFSAYRMTELMHSLRQRMDQNLAIRIYDAYSQEASEAPQEPVLYADSNPELQPEDIERSSQIEIDFGRRTWLLEFRQRRQGAEGALIDDTNFTLVGGLSISALVAIIFFVLIGHRQRAMTYAMRLTSDLRRAEISARGADKLKQAVLDAATEIAIVATDTDGVITIFNRGAENMLGYRASEVIGKATPAVYHEPQEFQARKKALTENLGRPVADVEVFAAMALRHGSEHRQWTFISQGGEMLHVDQVVTLQRNSEGGVDGYVIVAVDITDRERAQAELRRHRDHLQELVEQRTAKLEAALEENLAANQAKSDFLANMSHELRTPMHAILSFSGLGFDRTKGQNQEKLHLYFDRIHQSAERLLDLINDLLDLSKLEAGHLERDLVDCDLRMIIERTAAQLESLLVGKRLRLSLEVTCASPLVRGDLRQIERVIHNLLSNAIKYSHRDDRIRVSLSDDSLPPSPTRHHAIPALAITVEDGGIGIPESELEAIFDKFFQSSKTKSGAGGTGLGLSICREIVHAHHGTIAAFNNPGGGARFVVKLPIDSHFAQTRNDVPASLTTSLHSVNP